jgi:hypothetical protein
MLSHYRPKRPHAVITTLHEHVSPRGSTYLSGRTGNAVWMVSQIRNPEPGKAQWVLMVSEGASTPHPETDAGDVA